VKPAALCGADGSAIALPNDALAGAARIPYWHCRQQPRAVRDVWDWRHLARECDLHDLPEIHHGPRLAHLFDDGRGRASERNARPISFCRSCKQV